MSERLVMVNMGQLAVSGNPEAVLSALGLGSCVAVCAYDPVARLGGLIHVVLPSSVIGRPHDGPAKFADLGVPRLVAAMQKAGAACSRLRTGILGGANVLSTLDHGGVSHIGARNVEAVRQALAEARLTPLAEDMGGKASRTVRLHISDGDIVVKTVRAGEAHMTSLGVLRAQ